MSWAKEKDLSAKMVESFQGWGTMTAAGLEGM
jgi:hypothetical protein